MADNKIVSESEIMKGLESCAKMGFNLCGLAFELIKHKNAEIERLKKGVTFTFTIEDFDRIKEEVYKNFDPRKVRAEAINDFADLLIDNFQTAIYRVPPVLFNRGKKLSISDVNKQLTNMLQNDVPIVIDRTKKEMVGEE